jgi:PAS domain S-box-containing protein
MESLYEIIKNNKKKIIEEAVSCLEKKEYKVQILYSKDIYRVFLTWLHWLVIKRLKDSCNEMKLSLDEDKMQGIVNYFYKESANSCNKEEVTVDSYLIAIDYYKKACVEVTNNLGIGCKEHRLCLLCLEEVFIDLKNLFTQKWIERQGYKLQQKLCFLQNIMDAFPCPMFYKDVEGIYKVLNKPFKELLKRYSENFEIKNISDLAETGLISEKDIKELVKIDRQLIKKPGIMSHEILVKDERELMHHLLINKSTLVKSDEKIDGIVGVVIDVTNLKNIEAELDKSEERYYRLFDLNPEAIFITCNERILLTNREGLKLLGVTSSKDLLGKGLIDFVHPDYKEFVRGRHKKVLDEGCTVPLAEEIYINIIGEMIHVEVTSASFPLKDMSAVITVGRNINERKLAEKKVEEVVRLGQSIMDSLNTNIAVIDKKGEIIAFNKNWNKFASENGLKELNSVGLGMNYLDVCRKAQANGVQGAHDVIIGLQSVMDNNLKEFTFEYPCDSPDEKRSFLMIATNLSREQGGAVIHHINITQRKQAEEKIRKLSQAIEQSPNMIIISDKEGVVEYANPKVLQFMECELDSVLGKSIREISAQIQYHVQERHETNKILQSELGWQGEIVYERDGKKYVFLGLFAPIKNENEEVTHYLFTYSDITERKKVEMELQKSNQELQKVIQRLHEMQTKLIQQEKLAGIGQLAAGVAHEINNPLGFVGSNFDTLRKYSLKLKEIIVAYKNFNDTFAEMGLEDANEMLSHINDLEKKNNIDFIIEDIEELLNDSMDGLKRIKEIVSGLRWFSRIDQINEFEEYDLNLGVKNTLIVAKNEIKYHALITENLGDIPLIEAVGGEINQVLLNTIINAVHAIKEKNTQDTGRINISTFSDGNFVCCQIEDNGIGIPKENMNKIFNPFFTTKPVGQGTGLGLSIAYDIIINKHKGEILVDTELEWGTKFTIKLPIKQSDS